MLIVTKKLEKFYRQSNTKLHKILKTKYTSKVRHC